MRLSNKTKKQAAESSKFSINELVYVNQVFGNILKECSQVIEQLLMITSADKATMKDDERLKGLQKINSDIEDKYLFVRHFSKQVNLLALNRQHEFGEIQSGKVLYGLK